MNDLELATVIFRVSVVTKSILKLIDTLKEQIVLSREPTHIREKGKALDDVALGTARTRIGIQEMDEPAAQRALRREAKRQSIIEAITAKAAKVLPQSVSDKPVDVDWVAQFFNHCQDVSNEQMQWVWGRLLAGEVANPGSFSRRAISIVRVMSMEDADLFTRFCTMSWHTPEVTALVPPIAPNYPKKLTFFEFTVLDSLGLIRPCLVNVLEVW
jgi:hypothetical protein